jgi:hypothetical protein
MSYNKMRIPLIALIAALTDGRSIRGANAKAIFSIGIRKREDAAF